MATLCGWEGKPRHWRRLLGAIARCVHNFTRTGDQRRLTWCSEITTLPLYCLYYQRDGNSPHRRLTRIVQSHSPGVARRYRQLIRGSFGPHRFAHTSLPHHQTPSRSVPPFFTQLTVVANADTQTTSLRQYLLRNSTYPALAM